METKKFVNADEISNVSFGGIDDGGCCFVSIFVNYSSEIQSTF